MAKRGRTSSFTAKKGEAICQHIAEGSSVRAAASAEKLDQKQIFRWLSQHEDFRQQYARARDTRADARFDRIDDVIQDMRGGVIDAQQARVEIDAIKWQSGKESPKKYGDKHTHEHTGEGGGPVRFIVES